MTRRGRVEKVTKKRKGRRHEEERKRKGQKTDNGWRELRGQKRKGQQEEATENIG